MRRAAFAIAAALTVHPSLAATISDPTTLFSLVCVTDKSTGFNWVNGDWVTTNYLSVTYVLNKFDNQRCNFTAPLPDLTEPFSHSRACYSFDEIGKAADPVVCDETWTIDFSNEEKPYLWRVQCRNWHLVDIAPKDGKFVVTRTYAVFTLDTATAKDSISLELGKCSQVN